MIRLLPFILVPVLIIAGLGYWRFAASPKSSVTPTQASSQDQDSDPVEVPKTLPGATVEERVKSIEDTVAKLVPQVNNQKSSGTQTTTLNSIDARLADAESTISDLKTRISALEKATPGAAASVSQPTIYIPMGSAAGPWTNTDWSTLSEYEISLDSGNYPGYTGMILEVNFRVADPAGTGSVRLYNVTDASVLSSQLDTTSTSFKLYTTSTFKLAGGQKTYKLQMKSSGGKDLYIQSARIKVSF